MKERLCNLFEVCESPEAPLCPLQLRTVKNGIWYPDEPICQAEQFQGISWIKKQRQIAALRLTTEDGFFTVRMLEAIHVVTRNLKGADPDDPKAERNWFRQRAEKRAVAFQKRQKHTAGARKKTIVVRQKKQTKIPTLFKL